MKNSNMFSSFVSFENCFVLHIWNDTNAYDVDGKRTIHSKSTFTSINESQQMVDVLFSKRPWSKQLKQNLDSGPDVSLVISVIFERKRKKEAIIVCPFNAAWKDKTRHIFRSQSNYENELRIWNIVLNLSKYSSISKEIK